MPLSPGPGDRIEARCTRCNDVTGHVVVALVRGEIVKVECRACGSVHKYYPPIARKAAQNKDAVCRVKPGEARRAAVAAVRPLNAGSASPPREAAATGRVPSRNRREAELCEESWKRTLERTAAEPRPYTMDTAFAVGDVVEHPAFGQGVVNEIAPPDKMRVLFRDGVRLLRCRCA